MTTISNTSGERLFKAMCVRRGDAYRGQFDSHAGAVAARKWAMASLPAPTARIRTLRNFIPTLGHPVYELTVTTGA